MKREGEYKNIFFNRTRNYIIGVSFLLKIDASNYLEVADCAHQTASEVAEAKESFC